MIEKQGYDLSPARGGGMRQRPRAEAVARFERGTLVENFPGEFRAAVPGGLEQLEVDLDRARVTLDLRIMLLDIEARAPVGEHLRTGAGQRNRCDGHQPKPIGTHDQLRSVSV